MALVPSRTERDLAARAQKLQLDYLRYRLQFGLTEKTPWPDLELIGEWQATLQPAPSIAAQFRTPCINNPIRMGASKLFGLKFQFNTNAILFLSY
jgi:hypothetical protein